MARKPCSPATRKKRRWGVLLALAVGAAATALYVRSRKPPDPTRFGPERFLKIESAEIAPSSSGSRLVIGGSTNLPDGARLDLALTTEDLVRATVICDKGRFGVELADGRTVTNGTYRIFVTFDLAQQSPALCEAIRYQPLRLDAESVLVVTSGVDPAALRSKLKDLIRSANTAVQLEELRRTAAEAEVFERELWISTLLPGARRLRTALDAYLAAPRPDKAALRQALVEADVLASS